MSQVSDYAGTAQRTFRAALLYRLEHDYGLLGSRKVLELLAEDVETLVCEFFPDLHGAGSGTLVWTATLDTGQKAQPGKASHEYPLVTITLPLITEEDIQEMIALDALPRAERRVRARALFKRRLGRLVRTGLEHPHGPALVTRADLALMLGCSPGTVGKALNEIQVETGESLPTKGYRMDQGAKPTHKAEIIRLYEAGISPPETARRTNHSQRSVDRYIADYERVKLLLEQGQSSAMIERLIRLRRSVVVQHIALVYEHHPCLKVAATSTAPPE